MYTSVTGLLDPRWREQQNKQVDDKKQQDEIFAVGMYMCTLVKCSSMSP